MILYKSRGKLVLLHFKHNRTDSNFRHKQIFNNYSAVSFMKVCISFKHKLYQMLFYTFQPTDKIYEQDCGIL